PLPPVAVNAWLYATLRFPYGSDDGLIASGVTLSVNCRAAKFAALPESAALIRKVYTPDTVGVPLSTPLPTFSVTPLGSAPPITDQVNEPTQHADSVVGYDAPVVAEPRSLPLLMLTLGGNTLKKVRK